MTDKDYIVRVTLGETIEVGGVMVLIEVVNPNHLGDCAIDPIEITTECVMVDPCTAVNTCNGSCADTEEVEHAKVVTTVIMGEEL